MSGNFRSCLHFSSVCIENVSEKYENQKVFLSLQCLNRKIVGQSENTFLLINGTQSIEDTFVIENIQSTDRFFNDDFMFKAFGENIKVQLAIAKKTQSKKSSTKESFKYEELAESSINLLNELKLKKNCSEIIFKINSHADNEENLSNIIEICLKYEVNFVNPPVIESTFEIQLLSLYNFDFSEDYSIEACCRFPFDDNFRAAILQNYPINTFQDDCEIRVLDDYLKKNKFTYDRISVEANLKYENFQTHRGVKLLNEMIVNGQKLLIEMKNGKKMFMAFVDLDIFNYPGLNCAKLISPLYEWNKNIIRERFQQEACLVTETKDKKNAPFVSDTYELVAVKSGDELAAVEVILKFSNPTSPKLYIANFITLLNEKYKIIKEIDVKQKILEECHENFKSMITEISASIEKVIDENADLDDNKLTHNVRKLIEGGSLYDKNKFRDAVKTLIGNKFCVNTKTNHEFKIFLISVFKELNREMIEAMKCDEIKEENESVNFNELQIEEWLHFKKFDKIKKVIEGLKKFPSVENLTSISLCHFEMENFTECEESLLKILSIDARNSSALYLFGHILIKRKEFDTAEIVFQMLTELNDTNIEYWMIMRSIYEVNNSSCGVKYCDVRISNLLNRNDFSANFSILNPAIIFSNIINNILWKQLTFPLPCFTEITKDFINNTYNIDKYQHETVILDIIESSEDGENVLQKLKSFHVCETNEFIYRHLKGNAFFRMGKIWNAVCQYEISFNLCLKLNKSFPLIPALRCGDWYLNEMQNTAKAHRYYNYCCKAYGTFQSWMGLGSVYYQNMDYKNAENCFMLANKIDKTSGDNWLYLALVNCKLNRLEIATSCYLIGKKFPDTNDYLLSETEMLLDL